MDDQWQLIILRQPETAIPPPAAAAPRLPGSMPTPPPQPQSSNSEGWAGWAISAVSDKLTNNLMNAAIGTTVIGGTTVAAAQQRTPVSPVADAGLKDMSSRSGASIVTSTSVAGGVGVTAGGWDTINNEGWDEEIPFDDSLWGKLLRLLESDFAAEANAGPFFKAMHKRRHRKPNLYCLQRRHHLTASGRQQLQ